MGFPGGSVVKKKKKNLPANAGDVDSIPGSERSPREGNGNPDSLEKEMATHSRILAWEIPWTDEPGKPQFMGSQRVRHD